MKPFVVILMGSKSDQAHCDKIAQAAREFGLEVVLRVGSAHKTAEHTLKLLHEYEKDPRPKVYITVAGRSNALSGFVDGAVGAPVIACPPPSESYGDADFWSSLRMPAGIASAVVLEPINAALLAAKVFGLSDTSVRKNVEEFQQKQADKIVTDDKGMQSEK